MKLPEKGEKVSLATILMLAQKHGYFDIVKVLEDNPPEDIFVSDGCSMWPDSWFGVDIYPECFWHDVRYWCGVPGDEIARLLADIELAKGVALKGEPGLARTMFTGVGFGGSEKIPTPFRWGYGR